MIHRLCAEFVFIFQVEIKLFIFFIFFLPRVENNIIEQSCIPFCVFLITVRFAINIRNICLFVVDESDREIRFPPHPLTIHDDFGLPSNNVFFLSSCIYMAFNFFGIRKV